jgi:hypothetical protein
MAGLREVVAVLLVISVAFSQLVEVDSGYSWAENLAFDGLGRLFVSNLWHGEVRCIVPNGAPAASSPLLRCYALPTRLARGKAPAGTRPPSTSRVWTACWAYHPTRSTPPRCWASASIRRKTWCSASPGARAQRLCVRATIGQGGLDDSLAQNRAEPDEDRDGAAEGGQRLPVRLGSTLSAAASLSR